MIFSLNFEVSAGFVIVVLGGGAGFQGQEVLQVEEMHTWSNEWNLM